MPNAFEMHPCCQVSQQRVHLHCQIPQHGHTTGCLTIHPPKHSWAVSSFCQLWIMLLSTSMCLFLCEHRFHFSGINIKRKHCLVLWQLYASLLPGGSGVKKPPANAGDAGSIPGLGKSPGEGNGNPHRYSCPGNPKDREPGDLQSMGSQRVGAQLSDWTATMGGWWHLAMVLVYISLMQKNDGWGIYPPSLYLHQVAVQVFCPFLAEWLLLPYCAVLRVLHISWIQILGRIRDVQILPPVFSFTAEASYEAHCEYQSGHWSLAFLAAPLALRTGPFLSLSDSEPSSPPALSCSQAWVPLLGVPMAVCPWTPGLILKSIPSSDRSSWDALQSSLPSPLPVTLFPAYLFPPCNSPQSIIILCLLFLLNHQPPSRT